MYQYYISKRTDDGYDLVIQFDRNDVEFALEFFSPASRNEHAYAKFLQFVKEKEKEVTIKSVKIFISGALLAVIPFSMFTQVTAHARVPEHNSPASLSAQAVSGQNIKFNMTYLYGGSLEQQIAQVQQTGSFQTVSPSYFDIDTQGRLVVQHVSPHLMDAMHAMGIRVVPMLSNHWHRDGGRLALQDPTKLAGQIARLIEQYDLDGVNVDIENVTVSERDAYTQLVKSLREQVPAHKEVSVAVAANPNGWNTGWHGSYDYAALAQYADYLMIMAYDESWQGSDPGPVASLSFAERSIQYALQYAPADKIVLGVPFYGRLWSADGRFNGNGVGLNTLERILSDHRATITYSQPHQSPKAEFIVREGDKIYTVNGQTLTPGTYTVWFENEQSLERKAQLIHQYGLKGMGSWSLSQATNEILNSMTGWLTIEEDVRYGTVTADTLRVRQAPTTQSATIAFYSQGDRVTIVGMQNGWYRVKMADSAYGYVHTDYVELELPAERTGYAAGDQVRVRAEPSIKSAVLNTVSTGDSFTVFGELQQGWYAVRLIDGTQGYIHGDYVSFTQPVIERQGFVSGDRVNFREGPSTETASIALLAKGTALTLLGDAQEDWYQVRLQDGQAGFVHANYISLTQPIVTKTGYATGDRVRIRSAASVNSAILATVTRGTAFTVIGEVEQGWYRIRLQDGITGYISADYVSFTRPEQLHQAFIKGDGVRLRTGASTSTAVIAMLNTGDVLQVVGEAQNQWYLVRLSNGTQGYVYADYITFQKPFVPATGYAAGDYVRLRRAPSLRSTVLKLLKKGDAFTITGAQAGEWYPVRLSNGLEGYIHTSLVTLR